MTELRNLHDYPEHIARLDRMAEKRAKWFTDDKAPFDRSWGRNWLFEQIYAWYHKDECEYMKKRIRDFIKSPEALADYDRRIALLPPRSDEVAKEYFEKYKPFGHPDHPKTVKKGA